MDVVVRAVAPEDPTAIARPDLPTVAAEAFSKDAGSIAMLFNEPHRAAVGADSDPATITSNPSQGTVEGHCTDTHERLLRRAQQLAFAVMVAAIVRDDLQCVSRRAALVPLRRDARAYRRLLLRKALQVACDVLRGVVVIVAHVQPSAHGNAAPHSCVLVCEVEKVESLRRREEGLHGH